MQYQLKIINDISEAINDNNALDLNLGCMNKNKILMKKFCKMVLSSKCAEDSASEIPFENFICKRFISEDCVVSFCL